VDFKFIKDRENTKLDLSPLTPDGNFERDYAWYDFEIKRNNKRNKKTFFLLTLLENKSSVLKKFLTETIKKNISKVEKILKGEPIKK
jgi:hypothetical protein